MVAIPPGFRDCSFLSHEPLRRQNISSWQEYSSCLPHFPLLAQGQWQVSQWWVRSLTGGGTTYDRHWCDGPIREGLRGLQRRGRKSLTPWLCHSLSPQSFWKSLLVSWLICSPSLTQPGNYNKDLVLDQRALGANLARERIYIVSFETCSALLLWNRHLSKRQPWPETIPVFLQLLSVNDVSSISSTTGWWAFCAYYVSLCELNSIKMQGRKYSGPFSFDGLVTFPPQANHTLGIFISHLRRLGEFCGQSSPVTISFVDFFQFYCRFFPLLSLLTYWYSQLGSLHVNVGCHLEPHLLLLDGTSPRSCFIWLLGFLGGHKIKIGKSHFCGGSGQDGRVDGHCTHHLIWPHQNYN